MKVSEYLQEEFCIIDLKSKDKEGAIKEIIDTLDKSSKVSNKKKLIKDVLEREKLGSTGIGKGIAIPHARTEAVHGFIVAFGKSDSGIEFNSLDGSKVNLIFLMGADPNELNLYLRLLAELSKLLMNNYFRQSLILAKSPAEIIETIKKFENGQS